MYVFMLKSKESMILKFTFYHRRPKIYYEVEATGSVRVYLVNNENKLNYENERRFYSYSRGDLSRYHEREIKLPHPGEWYLIIHNPTEETTAIHYNVYDRSRNL